MGRAPIKSITVCVEFDDLLAITLPRNKRHFTHTLIVTSSADTRTQQLAARHGCECYVTDAFYERSALFNKGAAMEEGFDELGRNGWICVWDADIVMPSKMIFPKLEIDCLYTPVRCLLEDPSTFRDGLDWDSLPIATQPGEFPGHFQLFHATAVEPPWYGTDWTSAGGCDSDFQAKFPASKWRRPSFKVLHLGPEGMPAMDTRIGENWTGRVSRRIDTAKLPTQAVARKARVRQLARERRLRGFKREQLQPAPRLTMPRVPVRTHVPAPKDEIPRRVSLFWSGRMSWARYVTLYTLRALNPDWDLRLYSPARACSQRHWRSPEDDDHEYGGRDYRKELGTLGIECREWTPPQGRLAAAQACDLFQWELLGTEGGFYADLDIVWMRSLESLRRQIACDDAAFCLESGHMAIGFFAAQPGCRLFVDLAQFARQPKYHRGRAYQHYGADLIYRFAGTPRSGLKWPGLTALQTLQQRYSDLQITQLPDSVVYPYDWRRIWELYAKDLPVSQETYGLHWFGGATCSRDWGARITVGNWQRRRNTWTSCLRRALAAIEKQAVL